MNWIIAPLYISALVFQILSFVLIVSVLLDKKRQIHENFSMAKDIIYPFLALAVAGKYIFG